MHCSDVVCLFSSLFSLCVSVSYVIITPSLTERARKISITSVTFQYTSSKCKVHRNFTYLSVDFCAKNFQYIRVILHTICKTKGTAKRITSQRNKVHIHAGQIVHLCKHAYLLRTGGTSVGTRSSIR